MLLFATYNRQAHAFKRLSYKGVFQIVRINPKQKIAFAVQTQLLVTFVKIGYEPFVTNPKNKIF